MFTIYRFLGRSIHFSNGFSLGFHWVHGNGSTSKTSAVLAAYHPPSSITWGWCLDWNRPQRLAVWPKLSRWNPAKGYGSLSLTLPLIGGFTVRWQPLMRRRGA